MLEVLENPLAEREIPVQTSTYPSERVAWAAVVVLSLFYLLSMLDRFIITLLQKAIKEDLGVTDFQLSLLYGAAFAIVYAVVGLALGWAIDRFSRRKVVFWSVIAWSVSSAACGLTRSFLGLAAARAGVGAGEAGISPAAHSILPDMFRPTRLALPMSIYALGAKVGQAMSLLVGSLITVWVVPGAIYSLLGHALHGWQLIFLIVSLPGILIAFLIFAIPEPGRQKSPSTSVATFRDYFAFMQKHKRFFTLHHIGTTLIPAASIGMTSWAPAYFERVHGLSPTKTGALLGAALLTGPLVGMPIHGIIVDRWFHRGQRDAHLRYMSYVALLAMPFGVLAFIIPNLLVSVGLLTVFSMLICCYLSLPICALQLVLPSTLRGKSSAVLFLVAGQASVMFGPMIVAGLTDFVFHDTQMVGWSIACTIALLLSTAAGLLLAATRPLRRMQSTAASDHP